jgi:hypothetical protein
LQERDVDLPGVIIIAGKEVEVACFRGCGCFAP